MKTFTLFLAKISQKFFFIILLFCPLFFANAWGLSDVLDKAGISTDSVTGLTSVSEATTAADKVSLIFLKIINFILYIAGIGAAIMIIVAGLRLTFSSGSEEQIDGAKRTLLYAVLGLLAVILSFLIIQNVVDLIYGNA